MFRALPADLQLGLYHEAPAAPVALGVLSEGDKAVGFVKDGVEYRWVCSGGGGG
jgi:hypothetical protein